MSEFNYDIIIVGGGLAGQSLAQALADSPLKTAIFEASSRPVHSASDDDVRSLALSFGSMQLFKSLKLADDLIDVAYPIDKIHISDQGHFGFTHINAQQEKVDALGWIVPLPKIAQCLQAKLKTNKQCDFIESAQVDTVNITKTGYQLTAIINGEEKIYHCKLLIIADGARSSLRDKLTIKVETVNYNQTAISANVGVSELSNTAYERFTKTGPLAFLPLAKNSYSFVWCLAPEQVAELMALPDPAFLQKLQQAFGYRLGKLTWLGKRQHFPLNLICVQEQVRQNLVVLGNAAHNLHPVAGQGFNLALRDVSQLAQCLKQAVNNKQSIGSRAVLDHYLNLRQADQTKTIQLTHQLARGFAGKFPVLARNMSLVILDLLPIFKHRLSKQTMGLKEIYY